MNEYKIEKGIPIPVTKRGKAPYQTTLLMEIGDSVLIPLEEGKQMAQYNDYQRMTQWGRKNGRKFTGRLLADGLRIWRIK